MTDPILTPLQMIQQATIQAWDQFTIEHPSQWADIVNQFGDPSVVIGPQGALQNDAAYQALLAETNTETSVAAFVSLISPIIGRVVIDILGGGIAGL